MKIIASDYEEKEILQIIGKWAKLTQQEWKEIKYVDDLIKIANEHGIIITIEK